MKNLIVIVAAGFMLTVFSQPVFADEYEDCGNACTSQDQQCVAQAEKLVNDVEIQDAKDLCRKTLDACSSTCQQNDINIRNGQTSETSGQ